MTPSSPTWTRAAVAILIVAALVAPAHALAPEIEKGLRDSKYVYVATERKAGGYGSPAEIWYLWHDGAVYVASPPTTWRAKRIKAGRTGAKIHVGKADGPSFDATGKIVDEPAVHDVMFKTFAEKYADRWAGYEKRFRDGLKDGSRVLIKYTPKA
jgi:hypothetical protein